MLTPQLKHLLDFISERIETSGICPTYVQMAQALNLKSKSGIHPLLCRLEERGFIRKLPNKRQAIEVIRRAGEPSPASASVEAAALREVGETYITSGQRAAYRAGMSTAAMICDSLGASHFGDEIWRVRDLIHVPKSTGEKAVEAARKVLDGEDFGQRPEVL
jgi:hypothetical protein